MRYLEKADDFESFLAALNDVATGIPRPRVGSHPPYSCQIVGLPRSGTTVLYQLLARTGAVGYPSNLMAFFHGVPWVGAKLHVQLASGDHSLTLESLGGRTPEPLDPHEFGYFWRRVCGHTTNSLVPDATPADLGELQVELDLVASVFGQPVVYKNFLAIAHAERLRRLPRMRFVTVRRDPTQVAASLLRLRGTLGIPPSQPLGVQPTRDPVHDGDVVRTVARQVVALGMDLDRSGLESPDADTVVLDLTDIRRDPRSAVEQVLAIMQAPTSGLAKLPATLPSPPQPTDLAGLERVLDEARKEMGR